MSSKLTEERILIAVPYTALIAIAILGTALSATGIEAADVVWTTARWALRVVVIAATMWAFVDHRSDPRPLWVYAWLSFAAYEGVATLLTLVVWPLDNSQFLVRAPLLTVFVPLLLAMSFLPVVGVSIWASLRSRQTAVYTFFPYAAATVPLFVLSGITPLFTGTEPLVLPSTLSLLATAAFAIFFMQSPSFF